MWLSVIKFVFIIKHLFSTSMMPGMHPRHWLELGGSGGLLGRRAGHVRDWALPGWYWDVLPSDERSLVRSQPVVDPKRLWWRSRGPASVQRLESPAQVVQHRVTEEDAHVHRYMVALVEGRFSNTWQILQGSHRSYDPVMVPSLWVSTVRAPLNLEELLHEMHLMMHY
jgi:hypothetical protein